MGDYIVAIRKLAKGAELKEDRLITYVIRDLKPEIRTDVVKKGQNTLTELITAAQLAGDALEMGGGNSAVMSAIKEVKRELTR